MLEVCLLVQPLKKSWFATVDGCSKALMLGSIFVLIWGRILENAFISISSICTLIILFGIQALLRLFNAKKWLSIYQAIDVKSIVLCEEALLLEGRKIPVSELKSVVIESDGYAGKWAGRTTHTGQGKLTFRRIIDNVEEAYSITVSSSSELHRLRALAEIWKKQGINTLVMD